MKSKYENMKIIYNRSKFGWYWAPFFMAFWFLLYYLVVPSSYSHLPQSLTIKDEEQNQGRFIGERAEQTLMKLSKIGPKVVGSPANEQAAVKVLLDEINDIIKNSRDDLYHIEYDVQIASGNYVLWEMINTYQSIQNVVVKLSPRNTNSTAALLINSHYDSVPGSSGAGDSGAMVSIMLEVLRVISKNDVPMTHSIIFLFNGAEENPLQGSHAFITQHKWSSLCKAVINLDSAGSGGREFLFQSGPDHPWLARYYCKHVLHPYASTIGEELFQNGFVPSETDYRIFRDFGKIPGLDMAHDDNGYVYHTKYDRFNLIPRNTYQSTGDNLLALAKALANAPEMVDPAKYAEGNTVFYDVLGWFIVYYSADTGMIINSCVCVLVIATILAYVWNMAQQTGMFRRRIFIKFGILFGIQFAAVILSILLVITIAVIMDSVDLSMSWYSKNWMAFGLYFCPMVFMMGILPAIYFSRTKEHGLPLGYGIQLIMHSHCLILTLITIIMTSLSIRAAFTFMISIGFYTLSVLLNIITCFHKTNFLWLIPHTICQILPFLFYNYCCYVLYQVFIPMQGRDGSSMNPEFVIGGFILYFGLLFAGFLVPILCLFRKSKTILSIFAVICVAFIIFAATPAGQPYVEKEAPQRFHVVHTTRNFHNGDPEMSIRKRDSGFYVVPMDRHPSSVDFIFDNSNFTKANSQEDCENEVMCGFPIYSSRWLGYKKQSYWVPASQPYESHLPSLKILSKLSTSMTNVLYTLEIAGPDHMSFFIQPLNGSKLIDWTFDREPIEKNFEKPYFVYFSYALQPTPLRFNLEFERDSEDWSGSTFDIAIIGHNLHTNNFTKEFHDFLASFPSWAYVSSWISSYQSWRL